MADSQKSFWVGAAFVVVIAITGVTLWEVVAPDTDVAGQLAALNSKIDATNVALEKVRAASAVNDKLSELDAQITKTNAALADLTKSIPQNNVGSRIDALSASLKTVDATLAAIKQSNSTQIAALGSKIQSLNDGIAALQKAGVGAAPDKTAALETKLAEEVAKLQAAAKTAAEPKPSDVVVVYLHMPNEAQMPKAVATVSPLTVQFAHIGSTQADGQAQVIIDKVRQIIKGRKDCTISVAGFADTLGNDSVNLDISKKRARAVAAKLQAAFAGSGVQINEAAWGERRLRDWTPDRTPSLANRRVDVAVTCKQ